MAKLWNVFDPVILLDDSTEVKLTSLNVLSFAINCAFPQARTIAEDAALKLYVSGIVKLPEVITNVEVLRFAVPLVKFAWFA